MCTSVLLCYTHMCCGGHAGVEANFASFLEAVHTIFQLMFGEDMPTLWEDCSVASPFCTEDIYEDGKVCIF